MTCTSSLWTDVFLQGRVSGSYGNSIFNRLKDWQTDVEGGCTILQSHQQCLRIPVSGYPPRQLVITYLFGYSQLVSVKWYFIVVLICISLVVSEVEDFFIPIIFSFFLPEGQNFPTMKGNTTVVPKNTTSHHPTPLLWIKNHSIPIDFFTCFKTVTDKNMQLRVKKKKDIRVKGVLDTWVLSLPPPRTHQSGQHTWMQKIRYSNICWALNKLTLKIQEHPRAKKKEKESKDRRSLNQYTTPQIGKGKKWYDMKVLS